MKRRQVTSRMNICLAKVIWGGLTRTARKALTELTTTYGLSVAQGDVQLIDGRWYVTHAGLLRLAQRRRCCGMKSALLEKLSDPLAGRWFFKATVYKSDGSKGFVGYGDADPSNCSTQVHGAELRVAETRAVNRALRKAYGMGICSVEELGSFSSPPKHTSVRMPSAQYHASNGSGNVQPRLRDQLCVLIRQHNLDAALVKAYAADFCGTHTFSEASRDLVESFIAHLATSAKENRDALVCKLNSYAQPQAVQS